MTEKEVVVNLLVEVGIACQKAAQMLAGSSDIETAPMKTQEEIEKKVADIKETAATGLGLAEMSNKDALEVITNAETAEELKAIGTEEKARGSKARKGVMKAVQMKLDKLKNPPAQAEVQDMTKAFTVAEPAMNAADQKAFQKQFQALTEDQRNAYFNGTGDSLGKSLVEETQAAPAQDDFEDFGSAPETKAAIPTITEGELREKFRAYAKANGTDAAHKVLAHFDVKKIAELDPANYGTVAAEL